MPYNYQGPSEQDPRYEDIMRILGADPQRAPQATDFLHLGSPQPKLSLSGQQYSQFMPQGNLSSAPGAITALLGLLGGVAPSRKFPNTMMPPGYRTKTTPGPGWRGDLPNVDHLDVVAPGSRERGTPGFGYVWDQNNPQLNEVFNNVNMRAFPQSIPRNFPESPDPYAGRRQGMARRRGIGPIDWDSEINRLANGLREGYMTVNDAANSLGVNVGTVRRELAARGHAVPPPTGRSSWIAVNPQERERVAQEVMAGRMRVTDGARLLGVSNAAVTQLVRRRRNNPEGTQGRPLHRNIDEIRNMEAAGISYDRIAAQFGATPVAVRDLLRRQGVYGSRVNAARGRPAFINRSIQEPALSTQSDVDVGLASMIRDSEQRMLNQRMNSSRINEALRREYDLTDEQIQSGFWRRR